MPNTLTKEVRYTALWGGALARMSGQDGRWLGIPTGHLTANVSGGTFSGNGIVGGNFDPSIAGVGIHTVTYSLSGCLVTTDITVNNIPITGPIQHY